MSVQLDWHVSVAIEDMKTKLRTDSVGRKLILVQNERNDPLHKSVLQIKQLDQSNQTTEK